MKDAGIYFPEINHRFPLGGTRIIFKENWAIHCTVSKRYEIIPEAKDECIGFRIAASINE